MSFIDQIAKLQKAKAELAQTEAKLAADRVSALSKLHSEYGYSNLNEFIKALKGAAGKAGKGKKGKAAKPAKVAKPAKAAKRTRAKITAELKQQVIAAVQSGQSGAEIANTFGISLPSVQNIKKEAGLVKARVTAESPSATAPEAPSAS